MIATNNARPQVPGGSGAGTVDDGRQDRPGVRGAKNPRARSIPRQTTQANPKLDTDKNIHLLTYNVRTLKSEERILELENALKNVKWDIIGLCEVRREGEDTLERDDTIFYYNGLAGGQYGVGFLIAKKWKNNIIEFISYSDRIALLKFKVTDSKSLLVVQVHAPTTAHTDDEVEEFYTLVNKAYYDHHCNWNIIMGDFNAKIGTKKDTDDYNKGLGPYGLGERNDRGARLIQFSFGQSLSICNSYFKKKHNRRWTWRSPDDSYKNEIDYFLSSDHTIVKNIQALNTIQFSSDHRPLRATLSFNTRIYREKLFKNRIKRLDKETLISNAEQFNLELSNSFSLLQSFETVDVQQLYNNIEASIKKASNKIKGKPKRLRKFTAETIQLLEERAALATNNNDENYKLKNKQVRKFIKRDLRAYEDKTVQIALENNRSLKIAKNGISRGKSWITSLKDRTGTKHQSREKILEICTEFYRQLYSDPEKTDTTTNYHRADDIPPITSHEIHCALLKMKYSRTPGEDGISTEALKLGTPTILPHLTKLFNSILDSGKFPTQFCHSNIILLHKKGDKSDINNYRPISLVSHVYKAFIKVIETRIARQLDSEQPPEQAGFRPGLSTTDHLHTINQLIEKHHEYNIPLYMAFVDFSKAFDSIFHKFIFLALQQQNIHPTYIDLLKLIYLNSTASIKLQSSGKPFPIEKGVKQGDPLSPKLFTATLEEVFRKLAAGWRNRGIVVGGVRLTNLRFADDIVLFANTAQELQAMLEELSNAILEVGLQMNMSKTKVMTNSSAYRITVNGEVMHYVHEYIYLGQLVSLQAGRQDKEVARRTESAWRSYWSMKEMMKGNLPIALKRKLMDMCILPVLTYGSQTWSLTNIQKSKLKVCQRAMERSMLGVKRIDRIRNTILRSRTKIADAGEKAAKLKWDWAGHVCRMPDTLWAKISTVWRPETARRSRGRPRRRWRDELDAYKRDWQLVAQNREEWRDWGEAFAQQWDITG